MQPIITQTAPDTPANLDGAARLRADRLAQAATDQMEAALAFLSMIDPEAFDIAFTAVETSGDDEPQDDDPVPLCRICYGQVGIFPEHGLAWQHYRGDGITSGAQEIYDASHAPEIAWYLPDENPEDL